MSDVIVSHQVVYRFKPQPDITALELCQIEPWFNSYFRLKEYVPAGCERHFVDAGTVPVLLNREGAKDE